MAVAVEKATTPAAQPDEARRPDARPDIPPPPSLGRSVRYVGPVQNVDMNQSPHPMNQRGELGKALFNYQHNTVSKDPLTRVSAPNHFNDKRNFIATVVNQASKGTVNPKRVPVDDPEAMTRHIKAVAHYMGADFVTIAKAHPNMMYAGNRYVQDGTAADQYEQDTPADLVRKFPYLIVATTAWDYDKLQAHRHHIGDAAYHVSQIKGNMLLKSLEGYIRELGYTALRGVANPQAAGIAGGMGELGRNGLVINEKFGARIHMPDPIMTDLPLVPGKPADIGVPDFCTICHKCAVTCPTNSITFFDRVPGEAPKVERDASGFGVYNGVEKFKINWLTCYKLRPYVHEHWSSCLTCAVICPFTKPNTWWRTMTVQALHYCPIPARPLLVRTLKAIDDRFWGVVRQKRVRWMGYDSGIKPGEQACTVAGCTADHEAGHSTSVDSEIGYYAPLKENTNRFVKRGS
ncbi:MAG TPA: reductive dehalogenase domain-containing protein [Chloroflexota bacterium]|nr:reductive dehalogenase domain-containing protein [Chloroflexota bacterium]